MNARNFFAELKRRNVYKVAIAYPVVAWLLMQIASQIFPLFAFGISPSFNRRNLVLNPSTKHHRLCNRMKRLFGATSAANNDSAVVQHTHENALLACAAANTGQVEIATMMAKSSASITNSQLFSLAK